jgi:alginate O-acetyltransferase complex protein AlgI
MLFSSAIFIFLFLPAVLAVYYNPFYRGRSFRNIVLFVASIYFYAWGEPFVVLLLLSSIIVNWMLGAIAHGKHGRIAVTLSVLYNVGVLFIFKYLSFSLTNLGLLINRDLAIWTIALPIGISFYSFQALSYVIDIYRSKCPAQRNPLNVGLYIALFPQLIAGPIVRYSTIESQIMGRRENVPDFCSGVRRFIIGFGKKLLVANQLGYVADLVFNLQGESVSVATAWLGVLAYTFQIYYDFSGYSDMAIGLGRMFGFHFLENFNYPYIARSISEFWRRWHISLSTWFRDYVYFPMGGSRVGSRSRLVFNLFVVWMLTGIWHGANWTFVLWGAMYFALLTIEKLTGLSTRLKWAGHIYTLFFVMIGWVVFRAHNLNEAVMYLHNMFGVSSNVMADGFSISIARNYGMYYAAAFLGATPLFAYLERISSKNQALSFIHAAAIVLLFFLSISSAVNQTYNPFIYFNF